MGLGVTPHRGSSPVRARAQDTSSKLGAAYQARRGGDIWNRKVATRGKPGLRWGSSARREAQARTHGTANDFNNRRRHTSRPVFYCSGYRIPISSPPLSSPPNPPNPPISSPPNAPNPPTQFGAPISITLFHPSPGRSPARLTRATSASHLILVNNSGRSIPAALTTHLRAQRTSQSR